MAPTSFVCYQRNIFRHLKKEIVLFGENRVYPYNIIVLETFLNESTRDFGSASGQLDIKHVARPSACQPCPPRIGFKPRLAQILVEGRAPRHVARRALPKASEALRVRASCCDCERLILCVFDAVRRTRNLTFLTLRALPPMMRVKRRRYCRLHYEFHA